MPGPSAAGWLNRLPLGGKLRLSGRGRCQEGIGRYRASYRFKFPGPERYQFRVLCKQEADFPFLEASSNVVAVVER